ncbi:MAG: type II and III secretion system protein [Elusimicrobiota bacterium]|jgi:Flp pilus assembly secretin CpaC|nr:type II and III secretion system protein [Elusimicrobiota bacterium]
MIFFKSNLKLILISLLITFCMNLYAAEEDMPMPEAPQPMIEVSVDIIEISQTKNNVRGISWNDSIQFEEGLRESSYFNFTSSGGGDNTTARGTSNAFFKIGSLQRPDAVIGKLRMLIKDNSARLLANPKLATESGSQASFLVGGEIPVPVASPQGVSIEWKTYGINLQIRPVLIEKENQITAMIQASISDLDYANAVTLEGYSVPALLNRSANSKATVNDGGTIVIAGLKHSRKNLIETRVPLLGSIPIIGWFFRQKETTDTETSMVVFVTFKRIEEEKQAEIEERY